MLQELSHKHFSQTHRYRMLFLAQHTELPPPKKIGRKDDYEKDEHIRITNLSSFLLLLFDMSMV